MELLNAARVQLSKIPGSDSQIPLSFKFDRVILESIVNLFKFMFESELNCDISIYQI